VDVAAKALALIHQGKDEEAIEVMSGHLHALEDDLKDEDLIENMPNHLLPLDYELTQNSDAIPTPEELWQKKLAPLVPERRDPDTATIRIVAEQAKRHGEDPSFFRRGRGLFGWLR